MKWWMRERDQLIEQTLAFVEGVAAASPKRTEPVPQPEPSKPVEAPKPVAAGFMVSERAAFIHGANITIDGGYTQGLMG